MKLSVIIPTLNEEDNIERLLDFFLDSIICHEIIVVDGGSQDRTKDICNDKNVTFVQTQISSRARQMNKGVEHATGDVFYFVHADTRPLKSFYQDIEHSIQEGYSIGSYRFQFNSNSKRLKINAFFTRFNRLFCRGGDQTIFITKDLFEELEGYNEEMDIMEEYDLIKRAKRATRFKVIPKNVIVSARKYDRNSYTKVSFANFIIFAMFYLGFSSKRMKSFYFTMIK